MNNEMMKKLFLHTLQKLELQRDIAFNKLQNKLNQYDDFRGGIDGHTDEIIAKTQDLLKINETIKFLQENFIETEKK